jgi:hypothetical protein
MIKKYLVEPAYRYIMLRGKNEKIENNDFFEIYKVCTPHELKLVYIEKKLNKNKHLVIESIATDPMLKNIMIIEFNSALSSEKINFLFIVDKNNY